MKARNVLATCVSALGLLMLSATPSDAGQCKSGCKGEVKACIKTMHTVYGMCRVDCLENGESVGACMRNCRSLLRDQRRSCRGEMSDCKNECRNGPGDGDGDVVCRGECGIEFGECALEAVRGVRDCRTDCPKGPDRRMCVATCKTNPAEALSECREEFEDCVEACDGPTTTTSSVTSTTVPNGSTTTTAVSSTTSTSVFTTSTTTTTLPTCECAEVPACIGTCPPGQQCVDLGEFCGCVGGSPSPAFID